VGKVAPGYRPPEFSSLVRSIVYQQLSGKAARTIHDRLENLCRERCPCPGDNAITPESIRSITTGEMRRCGLSHQKLAYIRDLAEHAAEGRLDFGKLPKMSDEEVIAVLTEVKGIGVWTAQMFLMFALRRPDVLPVGDLGIQNAIKRAYNKRKVTPKDVARIGKKWSPHSTLASYYLWRSLDAFASGKPTSSPGKSGKKRKSIKPSAGVSGSAVLRTPRKAKRRPRQ